MRESLLKQRISQTSTTSHIPTKTASGEKTDTHVPKRMGGKEGSPLCKVTDMARSGAVHHHGGETPSSALAMVAPLGHCTFGSPGPAP